MLVPLQGAALGCCCQSCVCARFGAGMLVPLQGAGAEWGCCCRLVCAFWGGHACAAGCRVPLLESVAVSGVCALGPACCCGCRVLLEGAAVRVVCAVWSGHASAAGCRVPLLESAAVSAVCTLGWASWCRCRAPLQGAAAEPLRCCLKRLPLSEWCVRFGAGIWCAAAGPAWRCCCWSGVCALEWACWSCRCRVLLLEWYVRCGAGLLVPLHGAVAGLPCRALLWECGVRYDMDWVRTKFFFPIFSFFFSCFFIPPSWKVLECPPLGINTEGSRMKKIIVAPPVP